MILVQGRTECLEYRHFSQEDWESCGLGTWISKRPTGVSVHNNLIRDGFCAMPSFAYFSTETRMYYLRTAVLHNEISDCID